MSKPETIILAALKYARDECGCRILRGPIFDFCDYSNTPDVELKAIPDCNALGAVLLQHKLQKLCYPDFKSGWDKKLCDLLETDWAWVWRFSHGWNHGRVLTFEVTIKGKDKIVKDEVSRDADKLAREWTA